MLPFNGPSHAQREATGSHVSSLPQPESPATPTENAEPTSLAIHHETTPVPTSPPVKRKPLPMNASPVVARSAGSASPRKSRSQWSQRSSSLASTQSLSVAEIEPQDLAPRDLDIYPRGQTSTTTSIFPTGAKSKHHKRVSIADESRSRPIPPRSSSLTIPVGGGPKSNNSDTQVVSHNHGASTGGYSGDFGPKRMQTMPTKYPTPPFNLSLKLNGITSDYSAADLTDSDDDDGPIPKQPVSPAQRFTSFFGWKPQQPYDSPTTTFSDKSLSPVANGLHLVGDAPRDMVARTSIPAAIDIPKANGPNGQISYFNVPGTPLLSSSPSINAHVEELERELREVSAELAGSIRREMELEDEVDRWKSEAPFANSEAGRRTSDYYSDSGASSVRYPISDTDSKIEELEKLRRKAEQEKAQFRVDMAEKAQQEMRNRRDLEAQVHALEDRIRAKDNTQGGASNERVQSLEKSLEDTRRKLNEERQTIQNFEDLLTALREELEPLTNERDNLRDEVVPKLRAQLEGLETQATDHEQLVYENTRMQQELQAMRTENETLKSARRMQLDMQNQSQRPRFDSIAEESESSAPRIGLTRSNSLVRSPITRSGSLSRSNSVKDRGEKAELPSFDRVKDVEEQRDALHKALKNLLERQEVQARNHAKLVKRLEAERDEALNGSPRRQAFSKEVKQLRQEVNSLRQRADDALDQKYQCEKGLGSLKLNLDRAQEETTSLRELLERNDIFVPESSVLTGNTNGGADSLTLDRAYKDLRATHALSMARIKEMEKSENNPLGPEVEQTLELLKQSITEAEAERDFAMNQAQDYRREAKRLQQSEMQHIGKEQSLAKQLNESASRMDQLASQVQQQLQSNTALRQRLADAIGRGEEDQKSSAARINDMQTQLRTLEDKVMSAQQDSEDALGRHEQEVRELRETHNAQLQRMRGMPSPGGANGSSSRKAPLSPLFMARSPRLDKTTSGLGITMAESTQTESLENRVKELETALSSAEQEMQEVVGRMNLAQMEVADLQSERDQAMNQTRRLQSQIDAERQKVEELMK
ncbi:MAG: hypothetical protein M1822_007942 [Bathelium mastoideum]|nr:MAG: hypothetical protein M1822_007942 [Bathelium mastoideum]